MSHAKNRIDKQRIDAGADMIRKVIGGYQPRQETSVLLVTTIPRNHLLNNDNEDNLDGMQMFGGNPYAVVDCMIRYREFDPEFTPFFNELVRALFLALGKDEIDQIVTGEQDEG